MGFNRGGGRKAYLLQDTRVRDLFLLRWGGKLSARLLGVGGNAMPSCVLKGDYHRSGWAIGVGGGYCVL